MDQLLRLNEETLKWHVLCQLLSSSVLERLLKTLYEVCPSFNADTPVVARLYHETEQACLDVVKNFILIGEANRLLQGSSGVQSNSVKPRPVAEAQPMRRLAPKPLNQLFKSDTVSPPAKQSDSTDKQPNPAWVNQINQNIQLQLKQLNSQANQSSPSSSRVGTPSSPSPGPLSQLPAANGPVSQLPASSSLLFTPTSAPVSTLVSTPTSRLSPSSLSPEATQALSAQLTAHLNKQDDKQPATNSPIKENCSVSPGPPTATETPQQNGLGKQGEVPKFEKQVSELKNYMDEVKALFDVFNDPSPKNKEAVNALSQAISVNSAVTQELQNIIKTEPELPASQQQQHQQQQQQQPLQQQQQQFNPLPVSHYFPIEQLMKQHQDKSQSTIAVSTIPPTHTHTKSRSSKEKLNCKDCGQMFQYSYQMERHIATRHSYIKKIICDICKKTFGSPGALKRHHETIHQKIKRFTCEHCGKKFGRKDHMKFHISTVHTQKKEAPIDQSILDAAITNATTASTELRKPDDPLDELKQRIRDMSENHARELNLQQQLQQQQLHQQQLQQHILAQQQQQQQTFDIQNVLNSINQEILKTSTANTSPLNGSVTDQAASPCNGVPEGATEGEGAPEMAPLTEGGVQQVDIEMDEDSVQVDVMEEGSNGNTPYTNSSPYNSEVIKETSSAVSAPPTHVTVT